VRASETLDLLLLHRGCDTIVNSAEEKPAYVQGVRLGQDRSKPLRALRAARDASKRHRPLGRLWPIMMHDVQPGRQKRESPIY